MSFSTHEFQGPPLLPRVCSPTQRERERARERERERGASERGEKERGERETRGYEPLDLDSAALSGEGRAGINKGLGFRVEGV